jgi:dCMP deaminase
MPYKDPIKAKEYHREYFREYMKNEGRKYQIISEEKRKNKHKISKSDGLIEYKLRRIQNQYGQVGVDVFLRDLCQCVKCGEPDFRILILHHKIPRSKGGKNLKENLETICCNCHGVEHFMEELEYTPGNGITQEMWDAYWMKFAISIEKYALCYSRKIGSVLTKDNKLISIGWNGPPEGIPSCDNRNINGEKICPRKLIGAISGERLDLCIALHAEAACITNCAREGKHSTNGTTLYCDCGIPCKDCLILIIGAGICRVVCNKNNTTNNYGIYYDKTSKYLHETSGMQIDFIDLK